MRSDRSPRSPAAQKADAVHGRMSSVHFASCVPGEAGSVARWSRKQPGTQESSAARHWAAQASSAMLTGSGTAQPATGLGWVA